MTGKTIYETNIIPLTSYSNFPVMKKIFLLFAVYAFACQSGYAQGFYARLGLGYAVPLAGQTMDGTATPYSGVATNATSGSTSTTSYDIKKMSFTAGLHGALGVGYMINNHVGIEGAFDFLLAARQYTFTDNNVVISGVASNVDITQRAKATLFIPALVLQSDGTRVNLYSRFGIALPLVTRVTQDQSFTNLPGAGAIETDDYTWEMKSKFSPGFSAAAGVKFGLNRHACMWAEVGFLSLAPYTKEADLTDVTVTINGAYQGSYLSQIPTDQRVVTYSTNFTAGSSDYYHQPAYSQPFSNFSISFGLSYQLGGGDRRQHGRNDVKSRRK